MKSHDLIGKRFGMLKVVGESDNTMKVRCVCDCGKEREVLSYNLIRGNSKGCGCKGNRNASKRMTTHGMTNTKVYRSWRHAKERCRNTNDRAYPNYGCRGITFCKEWDEFENFYKDMGNPPKGMSIERIDNDKGYCKDNCKWADYTEQGANKRNNVLIELDGKTMTASQWSRETGILLWTILARVKSGFTPQETLNPNFGKTFMDGKYHTVNDLVREYKIPKTTFHRRRRKGMSVKEALTFPRRKRSIK